MSYNIEAEKAVIATLLNNPELLPEIKAKLDEQDFSLGSQTSPNMRAIYRQLSTGDFDLIKLATQLDLPVAVLQKFLTFTHDVTDLDSYVQLIKDKTVTRVVKFQLRRIEDSLSGEEDPLLVVEQAYEAIRRAKLHDVNRSHIKSVIDRYHIAVAKELDLAPEDRQLKTPWMDLNAAIHGLYPGELTILGAASGLGKTSFITQIEDHLKGKVIVNFALEMAGRRLVERRLALKTGIPLNFFTDLTYRGNPQMEALVYKTLAELESQKIHLFGSECSSLAELTKALHSAANQHGRVDLITVDFIQLMSGRRQERRDLELGLLVYDLKKLAEGINGRDKPGAHLVITSQLSDDHRSRANPRPHKGDLRDSKSIAHPTDILMFIYREDHYNKDVEPERRNIVELLIDKNRNDAETVVSLAWEGARFRFNNLYRGDGLI